MKRLEKHKVVGIDMDGTLYGHHQSHILANYVRTNPYDQLFHIVTFRSHDIVQHTPGDLASLDLSESNFASIQCVPDVTYERYYRAITNGRDPKGVSNYLEWKGLTCKRIGATILLDDMTNLVEQGCRRYGIELIHPDDLRDWRLD